MHTTSMILQAFWFGLEVMVILSLLGFGLTTWVLPEGGITILLTPVVGMAVAAIGFQLFTPFVPPTITLLVLLVGFGGFSLWMGWRRRGVLSAAIRQHATDIGFTAVAGVVLYLALLAHVFGAGFFTLAGWPSDNVFTYAPSGEFLKTHAFNPLNPFDVANNLETVYLAYGMRAFPNSFGVLDGALSNLSGWQVTALFDPLTALSWSLVVPSMYVLLGWLGFSRRVRIGAVLLLGANQLIWWAMGLSNHQEALAMPLFMAALALTIRAASSDRRATAMLAGLVGGSLLGVYFPIFVVLVFTALAYLLILVIQQGLAGRLISTLRQIAWLAGSGLAATAASLFWLLPGGGMYYWLFVLHTRIAAGAIAYFYPLRYLLGMAPVADLWGRPFLLPLLWWRPEWNTASRWLVLLVGVLILAGLGSLALKRNLPALGLFGAIGLYLAYLRLVTQYPYGFMKSMTYVAPLTSALIAAGALAFVPALREAQARRRSRAPAPTGSAFPLVGEGRDRGSIALGVGAACLLIVLAAESLTAIEMEHLWIDVGPQALPASFHTLNDMARMVPHGSGVLQINPSPAYHDGIKYAAARIYLTDDNLLLEDHLPAASEVPFRFDFLMLPWPPDTVTPGPGFKRVWSDVDVGLALYQRFP